MQFGREIEIEKLKLDESKTVMIEDIAAILRENKHEERGIVDYVDTTSVISINY